ncbi:PTS sugar transporter subunit IIA [Enterococcus saccharolyticus]|uniref:PTS sugar transporter subunit IIA n=1 Tax=Enterococcus TaxID=1350 RepID=UPI001E3D5D49|nr:PTS sugar transporter subunit IIA [Enterococcus saccharolyticus]MCD5001959.1 PTS sugar transporter subunit IIA [Enterococcus saccharolyticus]
MKNELRFILASHGPFARAALETLEMIAGKQPNMTALELQFGEGLEEFVGKYEAEIAQYPEDTIIILTDIFGGTPSNAALQLLFNHKNIQVFSGFNIPLVLELSTMSFENVVDLCAFAEKNWPNYLTNINQQMQKREEVIEDEY